MSRRTVDGKEIPLPYKWKIDEELKTLVLAMPAFRKYSSDKSTYEYWLREGHEKLGLPSWAEVKMMEDKEIPEGKLNEAIKFFDKSLEIKPNVDACLGKASALEKLGKYDQAIKCYDDYLEKQPDNKYEVAEVWWYKGSLLTKLHRYPEAIQSYEKSNYPEAGIYSLLDIVGVFGQMGKYSEVIKRSEEIIRSEEVKKSLDRWSSDRPSDRKIGAMFFKANALDALGNFDEAIKCYDQVITAFGSAGALYYRGRSKVKNGHIMGGLSDLQAAIERNDKYQTLANSDKEFESIRNNAVFRSLVTKP